MEPIIAIVGFLGAGKTTLLKQLTKEYLSKGWNPFIVLNDYENANLDAQDFLGFLNKDQINALSGSCICCSGIGELREQINNIPKRDKGVSLIEANGTTDAISLMGFLGVGMKDHFLPPIQIAVVDSRNWQKRGQHNELEASQIQVSSLVILNYIDDISLERLVEVEQDIREKNSKAKIIHWNKLDIFEILKLAPIGLSQNKVDHKHFHWASCSIDLPLNLSFDRLERIIKEIPDFILRVKGYGKIEGSDGYTFFERLPNGEIFTRPYRGTLEMGPKLLTIGPGSDPKKLEAIIISTEKK